MEPALSFIWIDETLLYHEDKGEKCFRKVRWPSTKLCDVKSQKTVFYSHGAGHFPLPVFYARYRKVYDYLKVDLFSSINVIFVASTSTNMINIIFGSVTPYSLVSICQPSGGNITCTEITRHDIPVESFLDSYNCVQHHTLSDVRLMHITYLELELVLCSGVFFTF
jgi:hypothetical protein